MTSPATSGRKPERKKSRNWHLRHFLWNFLRKVYARITKFTRLSGITGRINLPDMTLLVAPVGCKMQLNTGQNWCIKRVRPAKVSNNSATVQPRLIKCCTDINDELIYSHTRYHVTSFFRLAFIEVRKTVENAASYDFLSNFSGVAFCLPHQLVGILLLVKLMC